MGFRDLFASAYGTWIEGDKNENQSRVIIMETTWIDKVKGFKAEKVTVVGIQRMRRENE